MDEKSRRLSSHPPDGRPPSPPAVEEPLGPDGRAADLAAVLRAKFRKGARRHNEGDLEAAIAIYIEVIAQAPDWPVAYHNLGAAYRAQGKWEAAVACYRRALEAAPGSPSILGNLGNTLKDLQRFEEAIAAHRAVVEFEPENAGAYHNLGLALKGSGDLDGALEAFSTACRLSPKDRKVEYDRALVLLQLGDFAAGWIAYEARWHLDEVKRRDFEAPRWDGQPFEDRSLLLHPEQGFGDTILASRFIPQAKALGGTVLLECKPELRRLFLDLEGVDLLVDYGETREGFDLHCPLLSVLGLLGIRDDNLPPPPRLHIPAESRRRFRPVFRRAGNRFKVGIIWSGSLTFKGNRWRSTTIGQFLKLSDVPGVQIYSLQKGPLEQELKTSGAFPVVVGLGSHLRDFADTAAVVDELDLVIMTDTAVAHLAGGLGKPVWNLLNFVPYWLYRMSGGTTPWYPSMRLYRQPRPGDWDTVFQQVVDALAKAVQAKKDGRWPG